MILDLIVLLFVLLLTLYMGTQGAFSALCLLTASLFASFLAMGLYQWAAAPIMSRQPDYAYGAAFLLLFMLAFAATRELIDRLVRFDMVLPVWPNRVVGGLVGFFAAMVIIGTTLIGIDMMPLPSSILGYSRYPDGMNHAATDVWLDPDGFVTTLWNNVGGASMGGPTVFASVNPDFLRQLYGYRHGVFYGTWNTLPPNLLKVIAMGSLHSDMLTTLKVPAPGQRHKIWLVQTRVRRGATEPDVSANSADGNNYLFLTPTQVRLVTTGGHQYYPIGYLKLGEVFHPLHLNTPVVDDYRMVDGHHSVYQDWIFKVASDERPMLFEMKNTARVALRKISKKFKVLAARDYPQRPYNKATLAISVQSSGMPGPYQVMIVPASVKMLDLQNEVHAAYSRLHHLYDVLFNNRSGAWAGAVTKIQGTPNTNSVQQYYQQSITANSEPISYRFSWPQIVSLLLSSQIGHNTAQCLQNVGSYFTGNILPVLRTKKVAYFNTDMHGAIPNPIHIAPSDYTVVAWRITGRALRIWMADVTVAPTKAQSLTLNSAALVASYSR